MPFSTNAWLTLASTLLAAGSLFAANSPEHPRLKQEKPAGRLVVGYAGSTAADHVGHMHALPELLEAVLKH